MISLKRRKTEPTSLWWTKIVVSIILLIGLIAYIVVSINLIINDEPSIQYSNDKLVSQKFPAFNITQFNNITTTINCAFTLVDTITDCSANLKLFDNGRYKFTPSENMNVDDNRGYVILSWNYIPGHDFNYISFGAELDDIKKKYPDQANLQKYIDYLQDLELVQGNKSNYFYIKWARREYLIRDWTNHLGFPNNHIPLRIAVPIVLTPMEGFNWTQIIIMPYGNAESGFFETIETEKRSETVLSNIGSLGGAISLLLGIYAILFGGSLLSPWGIFQNYCCNSRSKKKLLNEKKLPIIPLTEKNQLHYKKSKNPDISEIENHLISLTIRFYSLETILREYVINSDFLDGLTEKNKISTGESNKHLM
nr:10792_t:CDS:2 [Entrophospora candida]